MDNSAFSNIFSGQRYYHTVAFELLNNSFSTKHFWKKCGIGINSINSIERENTSIEHGKYISKIAYHKGDTEKFNTNKEDNQTYEYDFFAISIKDLNTLVICMPFKTLAKDILKNLLSEDQFLTKAQFFKPDLDKLIKQKNDNLEFNEPNFLVTFSDLGLTLTGDTDISFVELGGDRPLESNLYKNVFMEKINDNECKLVTCILKCLTIPNIELNIPKASSNIHMDLFGNFKFYIHTSGKNVHTIPFLFRFLKSSGCLNTTFISPISKSKDVQIQ